MSSLRLYAASPAAADDDDEEEDEDAPPLPPLLVESPLLLLSLLLLLAEAGPPPTLPWAIGAADAERDPALRLALTVARASMTCAGAYSGSGGLSDSFGEAFLSVITITCGRSWKLIDPRRETLSSRCTRRESALLGACWASGVGKEDEDEEGEGEEEDAAPAPPFSLPPSPPLAAPSA